MTQSKTALCETGKHVWRNGPSTRFCEVCLDSVSYSRYATQLEARLADVLTERARFLPRLLSIQSAATAFIDALEEEMPDGLECAKEWTALMANIAVTIRAVTGDEPETKVKAKPPTEPKYPPVCGSCREPLPRRSGPVIEFGLCPNHPDARTVYRSQVDGRPIYSFERSQDPGWAEWVKDE